MQHKEIDENVHAATCQKLFFVAFAQEFSIAATKHFQLRSAQIMISILNTVYFDYTYMCVAVWCTTGIYRHIIAKRISPKKKSFTKCNTFRVTVATLLNGQWPCEQIPQRSWIYHHDSLQNYNPRKIETVQFYFFIENGQR